jgi:hypothetical protein
MKRLTLATFAAMGGLAGVALAGDGGASETCSWSMKDNLLTGHCRREDGNKYRDSTMDLNLCLVNSDGNLVAQEG